MVAGPDHCEKIFSHIKIRTFMNKSNSFVCNVVPSFVGIPSSNLTSSMSAMMDQVRLRNTSPKNTRVRHHMAWLEASTRARNTMGADVMRPNPQIIGSQSGYRGRSLWAIRDPRGTPMMPAAIETKPNL